MAVYRFRITFEEHEDVLREIDILGKQNYEELHRAIQEAIGFDNSKNASFFISDDLWRKGEELALNVSGHDDDDDLPPRKKKPKKMSGERIADHIDDPHQRFVYVFDPGANWTLLMELVRIIPDDPKVNYPKTTKTSGAAPKQYKQTVAPPVEDEEVEDDEEDKKRKNLAFTAVEQFDHSEHPGNEEGEDSHHNEEESETASENGEDAEESEEEAGEDFDPGSLGAEGDDF
ncbi:MAG: hypothetical protein HY064_05360 [Bacteroidetes bacterium]|nr:hypothetical protein [Bacteroidota bacterium]